MKAATLKALKSSIAHWTRLATGKQKEAEGIFYDDCALCKRFYTVSDCDGCPVQNNTGLPHCRGTPWLAAAKAASDEGKDSQEFRRCANNMLKYLKSLLPRRKRRSK